MNHYLQVHHLFLALPLLQGVRDSGDTMSDRAPKIEDYETCLLIRQRTVGKNSVRISDLMPPSSNVLSLEIRIETLNDVPAAMLCCLR